MRGTAFIGHAVFMASLAITVGVVAFYRWLHKRSQRRSPLQSRKIGHIPGQQLLDRIEKHQQEVNFGLDVMMIALPMVFLIWATLEIDWNKVRFGAVEVIFIIGWASAFAYGFWQYRRHYRQREKAKDGLLAERVTGMQLNRLMADGCAVLHDLPGDGFNIDHVVIAPRGVYAVETKSFRKPKDARPGEAAKVVFDGASLDFSDFQTRKPLEQSRQQAQWLSRFLRETLGESIRVEPAVALPGWFVEKTEAGKASDVFVFTPMGRGCEWFTYGEKSIIPTKRDLIAQALATRYPTIE